MIVLLIYGSFIPDDYIIWRCVDRDVRARRKKKGSRDKRMKIDGIVAINRLICSRDDGM